MRTVVQRVRSARVTVEGAVVGEIGKGLLVLLGITHGDSSEQADWLAEKVVGLRIFEDDAGKMNHSLDEVGGAMLIVSQFTLYGDCRKGRRPSFVEAAHPRGGDAALRKIYPGGTSARRDGGHGPLWGDDAGRAGQRWAGDLDR